MSTKVDEKTKISYEQIGNDKSDTCLLFIHGAGGNSEALRDLALQFPEFSCILIDLPGHNNSKIPLPDTVNGHADIVEKFINSAKDFSNKNIICVGHSMGGFITLELALKKIPAIKKIVILNSGARIDVDKKFLDNVRRGKISKLFLFRASGSYFNPRTYKFFIRNFKKMITSKEVMASDFITVDKYDSRKLIDKIDLPTLIITGEKEFLAHPRYSEFLHEHIKNSKLEIVPGYAHLLPVVAYEKTAEIMKKNLA